MHSALTDPKINAPQWPLLRLFALAGLAWAVISVFERLRGTLDAGGAIAVLFLVGVALVVILLVLLAATASAVRKLRALEASVPPEGPDRMLFPTFGFGATGTRLMVIGGEHASPRGLWGWKLVEITPHGVRVHSDPRNPEAARFFAASEILDAAPGAITDGMLRIPTLNLAIETSERAVGLPLGLLRHPLAVMSGEERAVLIARVQLLLGVPRA